MAKSLEGACHCGAIGVAFEVETIDDAALSPRHCGCSFCQKHGSLYTSRAPSGRLTITLAEPDRVSRYAFGHKTATFLICSRCGVEAAAVMRDGSGAPLRGPERVEICFRRRSPGSERMDRASVPIADYEAEDVPGIGWTGASTKIRWMIRPSNVTIVEG